MTNKELEKRIKRLEEKQKYTKEIIVKILVWLGSQE